MAARGRAQADIRDGNDDHDIFGDEDEVRFLAIGPDRTRVELEHRHLDRHGEGWESERNGLAADDGWPLYLQRFADLATDS